MKKIKKWREENKQKTEGIYMHYSSSSLLFSICTRSLGALTKVKKTCSKVSYLLFPKQDLCLSQSKVLFPTHAVPQVSFSKLMPHPPLSWTCSGEGG